MKRFAFLIASAVALTTPGFAQTKDADGKAAASAEQYYTETDKTDFEASDLIGSRIYATDAAVNTEEAVNKPADNWDDIGEVNNLIVSREGTVKAVVVGVGGFLGIGEKNVALRMSELRFLKKAGDDADDYFVVIKSNKAQLENAPEFKTAD